MTKDENKVLEAIVIVACPKSSYLPYACQFLGN